MSETKKINELTNGWIICPSKSFPGKFYYFNVLSGEAAWSLNQADNQDIKKESSFHKITEKSHGYPEPTILPDETAPTSQNIFTNTQRPQFLQHIPCAPQVPTFGQAIFPKYVANAEPLIPNIVWTSVLLPMFCPERKPMFDKVTQISDLERDFFAKATNIPLCERFKNYEPPVLSFDTKNKTVNLLPKYETSTPKNSFQECVPESQNVFPKSLIKEPALILEPKIPKPKIPIVFNSNDKPIIGTCTSSKVEGTKPNTEVQKDQILNELESTDLRFLLLAKRRSLDTTEAAVEKKKQKPSESKPLTLKQKVRFNLNNETDDDTTNDQNQEDFIPLTTNQTRTIDTPALLKDKTTTFFIKDIPKTHLPHAKDQQPTFLPTAINQPPIAINQQPTYKNTVWYIVVDTDVLLLDYELIDKIVLSDPKCRLVIPFAVAADIEALCLGDCRGQQRVIHARQLTRKLAAPPPHYIVEPRTIDNGSLEVTTESILQCCMKAVNKNYYVVLITNDPHLQSRANLQNIPSYKLNEIKYGVDIKPYSTFKNIQTNTSNNDMGTKNLFQQNLNLFSNRKPEITSQENTKKITSRNDVKEKNLNLSLYNVRNTVKKQLFLSSDSETDNSDSDKLINITKPKCMNNIEDMTRPDSDGTSDISSVVSSLNLKDKNVLKSQNAARNPLLPQNVKENGFGNFENRIQNPNSVFNTHNFRKTIPNEKVLKPNLDDNEFQKDSLEYNFENTEKVFCSIPITNLKLFEPKSKTENSVKPYTQEPFGATRESNTFNPSQSRIKKIINTVNNSTTKTQFENTTTTNKDSTGMFKIPKLLPIKNATRNTSGQAESPIANDKIGTRTNIDPIDENLKRFRIKNKNMMAKIKTRIDEWACCYMQIMEEALVNILEKHIVCMKNTVAPLTLKDTLNCIKMLYDSHTKIRDITNKLSELLEKCMICVQGKLKLSVAPEDFMKLFGYGVLLVLALKIILPENEGLKEAELRLSALQINLESNIKEVDPELVKSPSVGCIEVDQDRDETRPPFLKKRSYVIDYLKKHFEQWATYKEDVDDHNIHKIENHTDFKVVRTCGKNLNLLKLDRGKTMTLSKNTIENDSTAKSKYGPKLIRLLENNQIIKPDKTVTIRTINETSPKLINDNSQNNSELNEIMSDKQIDVPLKKPTDNIEQEINIESKVTDLNDAAEENTEKDGPIIIRNIELIDEFEKERIHREPLDLDLLDYSEIYEPSINENVDFDIISEKDKKSEEVTNVDENNFGLTDTICIDDLFITPSVSAESKNTENSINKNNSENYNINSVSENNNGRTHVQEKTEGTSNETESETYTEKETSYTENNNSEIHICSSENLIEISETPNYDSGTHLDNSEAHTFEKTAEIVQDGSTNDSGFENDSTYAHSMIKIFLHELSTTFKAIHSFVTNFIEEIHETELSERRMDVLHHQASKTLEDMVAIIEQLKCIIKRESADDTVLKRLLRHAGVEATTDKRATRYRQIVVKCLEQSLILETALKIIVATTIGDFEALSINVETLNSSLKYFNIFE